MVDETITIAEAMALLGKSEKSVRNYIKRGRLNAELEPDGKYHIPKHEVLKLARHPAQIQADQLEKLTRKVEEVETRLSELEKMLEAFTSQPAVQTPTSTPQPRRKRPERQPAEVATTAAGNVPEGYAVFPHFLHGVPDSTAKGAYKRGEFTITEGSWKYGNHNITKLLSPGQQHEYWQAMHNHPQFKACPDCPHEV